jgi:hypothetical protein
MYYKTKNYPKKILKRIMRHKRTRYHNDTALFNEDSYSAPRKRTKSLRKRDMLAGLDTEDDQSVDSNHQ